MRGITAEALALVSGASSSYSKPPTVQFESGVPSDDDTMWAVDYLFRLRDNGWQFFSMPTNCGVRGREFIAGVKASHNGTIMNLMVAASSRRTATVGLMMLAASSRR